MGEEVGQYQGANEVCGKITALHARSLCTNITCMACPCTSDSFWWECDAIGLKFDYNLWNYFCHRHGCRSAKDCTTNTAETVSLALPSRRWDLQALKLVQPTAASDPSSNSWPGTFLCRWASPVSIVRVLLGFSDVFFCCYLSLVALQRQIPCTSTVLWEHWPHATLSESRNSLARTCEHCRSDQPPDRWTTGCLWEPCVQFVPWLVH